jgi:hypothetical protein
VPVNQIVRVCRQSRPQDFEAAAGVARSRDYQPRVNGHAAFVFDCGHEPRGASEGTPYIDQQISLLTSFTSKTRGATAGWAHIADSATV